MLHNGREFAVKAGKQNVGFVILSDKQIMTVGQKGEMHSEYLWWATEGKRNRHDPFLPLHPRFVERLSGKTSPLILFSSCQM